MLARRAAFPLFLLLFCASTLASAQVPFDTAAAERNTRHATPEWLSMAPYLPDPATGSPSALEVAADVMRARRMPEDALDYYGYALKRGGDEERLVNRMGITELELHDYPAATKLFQRAIRLRTKNPESWNNLGAAEFIAGSTGAAIHDYQHAIKLNKKIAVFHANLGTAYFQRKDYESAQTQFERAFTLDPHILEHGGLGGMQAHIMSSNDRGRFCFEMAKLSARHQDDDGVMKWLAQASEAGFDIRDEIDREASLSGYRKDERVALLIHNAKAMRAGQIAAAGPAPALPAITPQQD